MKQLCTASRLVTVRVGSPQRTRDGYRLEAHDELRIQKCVLPRRHEDEQHQDAAGRRWTPKATS